MLTSPYFWQIASVGFVVFVAELLFFFRAMAGKRRGSETRSVLWHSVLSVIVALIPLSMVVVLVDRGRRALVTDAVEILGPRLDLAPMHTEWNQQWVLLVGAGVGLPSLLLAGMAAGAAVSRRVGWGRRLLRCCAGPAALVPFFAGIWVYLSRLQNIHYPGLTGSDASQRAPILAGALGAAKHALDIGALVTALLLATVLVWRMGGVVRAGAEKPPVRASHRYSIVTGMALLAGAVILWWLSGPLVAENRIPFPRHDHRYTRRVFPVVPADLTQDALYGLNGKVWIGHHSGSLTFPLVSRKQNPLVLWSPVLEISNDRLTLNGREVTRAELHDQLVHELSTDRQLRQLRGDDGSRSPLIMALPNLPLHVVMDVLAVVYDMGSREVRFVTGLPETIQRPSFGALTRVIYQTTTVNLARAGDIDSMNPHHVLRLSKDLKRYRDVLDRLFESEPTSSPSVLLLD